MHFGAKEADDPTTGTWVEPFTFGVHRSSGYAALEFNARMGKLHSGGLIGALMAAERNDASNAAQAYYMTIAKMVDDRDGIPAAWEPVPLPQSPGDQRPPSFRVPWGDRQGELRPMEEAADYLENTPHSSRRRWLHLMEKDQDAVVQFDELSKLFEWMVGQTSGNRSAASS